MTRGVGTKVRWTAEEDAAVIAGAKELLGRTAGTISVRRSFLGLTNKKPRGNPWSVNEDQFLLDNFQTMTNKAMAQALGRTLSAVRNRVRVIDAQGNRTQKDWALRGPANPRWIGGSRSRDIVKAYQARRRIKSEMSMTPEDIEISVCYREAIRHDPCFYCGIHTATMQTDHFFAIAKGGSDHWWNLVRSCSSCNHKKATRCGTKFKLLGA